MNVTKTGALATACLLAMSLTAAPAVHGQSPDALVRAFAAAGRSSQIGVTVRDVEDADVKLAKAGVLVDEVVPRSPADKAGMKTGDAITEFDGERVRSVRQFTRLVQETPAGRTVSAVLSRGGQRVTVNVTPEPGNIGDEFGWRLLDSPLRPALPPTPPAAPRVARPPALTPAPAFPFDVEGGALTILANRGRLGITMEELNSQLAEYFGVKDGVLVKSVVDGSAAAKAGIKAGDVITTFNGNHVYDTSDVSRALTRMEDAGEFTVEIVRDRKTQTLKGKLEPRETRTRSRVRTIV
jgi:serine protease Do